MTIMTRDQFTALAALLQSRGGPTEEAVRRVLVDGIRQADAARELAVRTDSLNNALRRYKKMIALSKAAN